MSEYTREEILKLIEENGGPEGLDLSGKDLNRIDLSTETIQAELRRVRQVNPQAMPKWWWPAPDHEGIFLRHANLRQVNLKSARLQRANLGYANLQGANLSHARLQDAYVARANLQGANLSWAHLQVNSLWEGNLQGANLEHADLRGVDLKYVKSLRGAFFYGVRLDHTDMDRRSLGPSVGEELVGEYGRARDAYLRLKRNFDNLGDYAASAWAYQKERQMEKAASAPWRARRFYGEAQLGDTWEDVEGIKKLQPQLPNCHPRVLWFYTRHTLKWLSDWVVECLCCYGESIWRVLAWMLLVILGFAAYYQVSSAVVTSSQDVATSLWDHLIFSLGAFTTLQPARLQAARPGVELLTTIQAIIGISLAGLLGFVAGNRIRRS
jgi:hypothetical protein